MSFTPLCSLQTVAGYALRQKHASRFGYSLLGEKCVARTLRHCVIVCYKDLESKSVVAELVPELPSMSRKAMKPECISMQWSADGSTLYSGYTDNTIRVWGVS